MDKNLLNDTKLFEKIEIDWFSIADMKRRKSEFRNFYKEITEKFINDEENIRLFIEKTQKVNRKTRKNRKTRMSKLIKKMGGTRRMKLYKNTDKSHIVKIFLEILNMVKLYHWKTTSYAQHKATDELYSKLNENIDEFIEILMGKDETRIQMMEKRIELIDPNNIREFKTRIYEYRIFLTDFNMYFNEKKDSDLLSIRDNLLSNINQFLYLLTLS